MLIDNFGKQERIDFLMDKIRAFLFVFSLILSIISLVYYQQIDGFLKQRFFKKMTYVAGEKIKQINLPQTVNLKSNHQLVELKNKQIKLKENRKKQLTKHKVIYPVKKQQTDPVPDLSAVSYLVKDKNTNLILIAQNEYQEHSIASLTKLMSALVLLDLKFNFNKIIEASIKEGIFDNIVWPGAKYEAEKLWRAALVGSSNRAILSLVENTGLSIDQFVNLMNLKARLLGLKSTRFVEPTGLDENNKSTASDLALLLKEVFKHQEIVKELNVKDFELVDESKKHVKHVWNTDWLLLNWIPINGFEFYGGKTGYIPESGYNFITELSQNKQRLQVIILGAESNQARFLEAKKIATWVFNNYQWLETYVQ